MIRLLLSQLQTGEDFEDLPKDIIFHVIFEFSSFEELMKLRLVSTYYLNLVDEYFRTIGRFLSHEDLGKLPNEYIVKWEVRDFTFIPYFKVKDRDGFFKLKPEYYGLDEDKNKRKGGGGITYLDSVDDHFLRKTGLSHTFQVVVGGIPDMGMYRIPFVYFRYYKILSRLIKLNAFKDIHYIERSYVNLNWIYKGQFDRSIKHQFTKDTKRGLVVGNPYRDMKYLNPQSEYEQLLKYLRLLSPYSNYRNFILLVLIALFSTKSKEGNVLYEQEKFRNYLYEVLEEVSDKYGPIKFGLIHFSLLLTEEIDEIPENIEVQKLIKKGFLREIIYDIVRKGYIIDDDDWITEFNMKLPIELYQYRIFPRDDDELEFKRKFMERRESLENKETNEIMELKISTDWNKFM